MDGMLVVLCTCPDEAVAENLAEGLIENRLAACVNIVPEIRSIYRWDGEIQKENEVLMILKTTGGAMDGLETWLKQHHPYEVPEVLALAVPAGSVDYMNWVFDETNNH